MTLVESLQGAVRRNKRDETMTKERSRRWRQSLNTAMPVVLDTAGTILLSGSVMMLNVAAGVAAAGAGLLILNWRFYGNR